MRIAVVGAGVGGLAAGIRLAAVGHEVTVLEQAAEPGGKAGRLELDGFSFDTGPSLLTMPWVFSDLFADTGGPLSGELDLVAVEPVTRYSFGDGSHVDLSASRERARAALDRWSHGAGADWLRFLRACEGMWGAAAPFLTGPPPWDRLARRPASSGPGAPGSSGSPPRRPAPAAPPPDPRDLARVRPWRTLSGLARSTSRERRLRWIIERFATYAGADPRRAPAVLALAGYVEHAFGAWHVRGGIYALVEALARRLEQVGGDLRTGAHVDGIRVVGGRVVGVDVVAGGERDVTVCDALVWGGDAAVLDGLLNRVPRRPRAPSVSGLALMLGLHGRTPGLTHHAIRFPADYGAEFDDLFVHRRPVREPTLYVSVSAASDRSQAPPGAENWFVLVNAPAGVAADWAAYEEGVIDRLGVRERIAVRSRRTPQDLERQTGAVGGAIYGAAPHGRLATLRRPGPVVRGPQGLYRVGGTAHPGGGLPLVALGARTVAELIGPA